MSNDWILEQMEQQRIDREIEEYKMQEAYERGEYYYKPSKPKRSKIEEIGSKSKIQSSELNEQTNNEILELKKQVKELNEELIYIKQFLGLK